MTLEPAKCPFCKSPQPEPTKQNSRVLVHNNHYVRWTNCSKKKCHFKFKDIVDDEIAERQKKS